MQEKVVARAKRAEIWRIGDTGEVFLRLSCGDEWGGSWRGAEIVRVGSATSRLRPRSPGRIGVGAGAKTEGASRPVAYVGIEGTSSSMGRVVDEVGQFRMADYTPRTLCSGNRTFIETIANAVRRVE